MRYFFEIAYNGSAFHGWQRQQNATSVQEEVEKALSTILRQTVSIMGSGRTDTGVHCEQQFFHADFDKEIDEESLRYKLNSFLSPGVAIRGIKRVANEAHARFDAISRTYQYRISLVKNPFLNDFTYLCPKPLDLKKMNESAQFLLGQQDFESFSKVRTEVNNFICVISSAQWTDEKDLLIFEITANRFLRGMVRAIVGTMLQIGSYRLAPKEMKNIIESRNRGKAGASAPPQGLFLTQVKYSQTIYSQTDV